MTARSRARQRPASLQIHVSTKQLHDLRLSKLRAAAMLSTSATHLFRNSCWVLARISNPRVRVLLSKTVMLSFRCRHRPEATSTQQLASTTPSGTCGKPSTGMRIFSAVGQSGHHECQVRVCADQRTSCVHQECRDGICGIALVNWFVRWFHKHFLHSFRQTPKPYSLASVATMDEHQPRVQPLTIDGQQPRRIIVNSHE